MRGLLLVIFLSASLHLLATEKKLCTSFSDCKRRADATSIHRRKIQFFDEAELLRTSKDSDQSFYSMLLDKADSLLREASGDTGFRGEVALKVSHTEAYKKTQFAKAREVLSRVSQEKDILTKRDQTKLEELKELSEKH